MQHPSVRSARRTRTADLPYGRSKQRNEMKPVWAEQSGARLGGRDHLRIMSSSVN
jgi:hypothetical protein